MRVALAGLVQQTRCLEITYFSMFFLQRLHGDHLPQPTPDSRTKRQCTAEVQSTVFHLGVDLVMVQKRQASAEAVLGILSLIFSMLVIMPIETPFLNASHHQGKPHAPVCCVDKPGHSVD